MKQKILVFIFDEVQLKLFCFCCSYFVVMSKNLFPNLKSQKLNPIFSSISFMVSDFIFRCWIHFQIISVHSMRWVQFYCFVCGHPVVPASFIEKIILSPLNGVDSFVENQLTIDTEFYFWALHSIPLVYVSIFMPLPHSFDYYAL